MKTRKDILIEAKRISAEICQIRIDAEHWNTSCRKPGEPEIPWDPDGGMMRRSDALDVMISTEEKWHVYELNDCDCWLARSLEEAIADANAQFTGGYEVDDDAHRLTEMELHLRMFTLDLGDKALGKITFREQLNRLLEKQPAKPEMFSSTES